MLLTTIPLLTWGIHTFLRIINIFKENLFGWHQFLSKSGFFRVAQFRTLGKGRGPPSCADPKAPAYNSPENAPCPRQAHVFYTKSFFPDLAMPRPRPRLGNNHIGNLLPLEMCSLFPENDHSNKPQLHRNPKNVPGHCKGTFFGTTVLFLLRPIL